MHSKSQSTQHTTFSKKPLTLAIATVIASTFTQVAYATDECTPVVNTLTVTSSLGDTSAGTLREAITLSNAVFLDCSEIVFDASVTSIALAGATTSTSKLNIVGSGQDVLTISNATGNAISATTGALHIANISLKNSQTGISSISGGATVTVEDTLIDNNGRGIRAVDGKLTVRDTTISNSINNGIFFNTTGTNTGLFIDGSSIVNNNTTSSGGGLYANVNAFSPTTISIESSTFSGNTSESGGGGIAIVAADSITLDISNSTISGNQVNNGDGGGLHINDNDTVTTTIDQSTFSGNSAIGGSGGAIYLDDTGATAASVTIKNSTIVANSTDGNTGGIRHISTHTIIDINHTVIANNTAGTQPNMSGTFNTLDYSWVGENLFGPTYTITPTTSFIEQDESTLLIGDLADNGGTTETHLPASGSPLLEAGDPAASGLASTDQRGYTREVNIVDIGAVELQAAPVVDTTSIIGSLAITQGELASIDISGITTETDVTFSVIGLPDGLSFDADTATISGISTVSGTFELSITVSNGDSETVETVDMTVEATEDEAENDDNSSGSSSLSYGWLFMLAAFGLRRKPRQ